jgi:hypothetical protein
MIMARRLLETKARTADWGMDLILVTGLLRQLTADMATDRRDGFRFMPDDYTELAVAMSAARRQLSEARTALYGLKGRTS